MRIERKKHKTTIPLNQDDDLSNDESFWKTKQTIYGESINNEMLHEKNVS